MNATILIVLPILTILMFDLGLTLRLDDFRMIFSRPKAILGGLFGQLVLLPAIAFALGRIFDLEPIYFLGVMLIACSPGGSSSNIFSFLAKGDVALSVSLTAFSSVLTLITIPMVMDWTGQLLGNSLGMEIKLPVGQLLIQNLVLMMVPIILGILIRAKWYAFSQKLHDKLSKVAFPGLIVLISIFFIQNYQAIFDNFGQLGLCITTLILLAMGGGVIITWILKLAQKEQRTIVIEIGMQNAAQAIAAATSPFVFNNELIAIPAILYALMMNLVLLTYVTLVRRKAC